jgi:hypothetical protein
MKKNLVSFELSCDRCFKSQTCINVDEAYLPDGWVYDYISKKETQPSGPTGSVSYGSSGATGSLSYNNMGNYVIYPGNSIMSNYINNQYDLKKEYLCPDCFNIKDVLE